MVRHKKKCPHCKQYHYSRKAYNKCKRRHKKESWKD